MRTFSLTSFINLLPIRSIELLLRKCKSVCIILILLSVFAVSPLNAQLVLFDFDNAPLYTSLPIYQTAGGITAHLSATGQGYSIQNANVLGFTPPGFAGHILYPNSIYLSDIQIHFDQQLTDFSVMYCCQELGCDDAATMRVTAYLNGTYVGYSNRTATFPGTWPVDTLKCSFPNGFDSVVVHYQSPPPTCQDYGVVYLADNMRVTPKNVGNIPEVELAEMFTLKQNYPNPFNPITTISYTIPKSDFVTVKIFDVLGQEVQLLVNEQKKPGYYKVIWDATDFASGIYLYSITAGDYHSIRKMVLIK